MSHSRSSQSISLNTALGERYKITGAVTETADGDSILEGKDTVLNRKVSIVVAATKHNDRVVANARTLVTNPRSQVQVLDLGNSSGRAYLVTSFARVNTLLDTVLANPSTLAASVALSESKEALGEEIFGDEKSRTTRYVTEKPAKPQPISATREIYDPADIAPPTVTSGIAVVAGLAAQEQKEFYKNYETQQDYSDYDDEEDYQDYDDYVEEPGEGKSRAGVWAVAVAAILLLVIGVAVVFSSLNGMVHNDEKAEAPQAASPSTSTSTSASTSASASPSATPTPTETVAKKAALSGKVTRLVPSNPAFMADQDGTLGQMTDGNPATSWMSYGFANANFGGATNQVAFAFELEDTTTISELTIDQKGGTGGAFTVFTNASASLDGATAVGSGSFTGSAVTVNLDKNSQGEGAKYVIISFTAAPQQAQPIAGYSYGLRISEVSVSN
ncbi:serine/threonine protein kinase [uncultured Rothia sp.]|uniref:serine/threonine protein kinase n=1 Tax=uncultured Rothia sp. TaxID=316088 RepID=UPI003217126A